MVAPSTPLPSKLATGSPVKSAGPTPQTSAPYLVQQTPCPGGPVWGFFTCGAVDSIIYLRAGRSMYVVGTSPECDIGVRNGGVISRRQADIHWNGWGIRGYGEEEGRVGDVGQFGAGATFKVQSRGKHHIEVNGKAVPAGAFVQLQHNDLLTLNPADDIQCRLRFFAPNLGLPRRRNGPGTFHAAYSCGEPLNDGTFGTVYSAIRIVDGDEVAVKVLKTPVSKMSPRELGSVYSECDLMETVGDHPHFLKLHDIFEEDSIRVVMEFVGGGNLEEYLQTHTLSEETVRYFARQLCVAVKHMHGLQIAHRDLKPENILLTRDEPPIIKIADFGLSKWMGSRTELKLKTGLGTPDFMAPEVARVYHDLTEEPYDERADLWSLGVIIFYISCDKLPWGHKKNAYIPTEKDIDWDKVQGILSDEGIDLLQSLLQDNPEDRATIREALEHPWLQDVFDPIEPLPTDGSLTDELSADPATSEDITQLARAAPQDGQDEGRPVFGSTLKSAQSTPTRKRAVTAAFGLSDSQDLPRKFAKLR